MVKTQLETIAKAKSTKTIQTEGNPDTEKSKSSIRLKEGGDDPEELILIPEEVLSAAGQLCLSSRLDSSLGYNIHYIYLIIL